ncbi:hypothetical protein SAMN02745866_03198 [Alteromonadaceae bacterium Bs31]|nr:hypothetical protein SAMN02745866_03198 [Alteromonadaceae bacterium Bs31]
MINKKKLSEIYQRYGFEEMPTKENGICVFTLQAGHFHNADIVSLEEGANEEKVFADFKSAGFACKIRKYRDINDVEKALFAGFFSVESTKSRLQREYEKFTKSIVSIHADNAHYSYVKSGYFVNGVKGENDLIVEITQRLNTDKPILFLIEAAAGFGKTCTAYELLNSIINNSELQIPLFSELSRNRQAKIFRYVLLDEIDRSFPLLSSSLVKTEIKNGNVPVLLDGFDELLHSSEEKGGYDNAEPMLETIGDLLQGRAKVVLTTRRTAIFDGDEFHSWIDSHEEDFEVVRIRIDEPTVVEWLTQERYRKLKENNFPIEKISNPVILSYLRCISDGEFDQVVVDKNSIVERYFESMLERERVRQDLRIDPKGQYLILQSLARDMVDLNYTSESRDYIISLLEDKFSPYIDDVRKQYPSDERPSSDEIINKLASHALLDRSFEDSQGIGFVNEFVLGTFCADIILQDESGEWIGDQRFIEPSVISYSPRSHIRSHSLWLALRFCLDLYDASQKLDASIKLTGIINFDICDESVDNVKIERLDVGRHYKIVDSIFIDCTFSECVFDFSGMQNVTFSNCYFYNCKIVNVMVDKVIYTLGCSSDDQVFLSNLCSRIEESTLLDCGLSDSDIYLLEKFWPVGRATFMKHRPIKGICTKSNKFSYAQIMQSLESLKRKGILVSPDKASFLELNMEKLPEVKLALGRD